MSHNKKHILITGASSGIGKAAAEILEEKGFRVFGGGRDFMDVNNEDSVRSAFARISEETGENGLCGLVNNAGIAVAAPMEFIPIEKLRYQLETNVIGQVRVTQAFLPLVRKARGRIVNVSSIAGFTAFPFKGAYAASKFALEAVSDSLRRELKLWNIPVSIVEPGIIKTPIWERSLELFNQTVCEMHGDADKYYGKYCDPLLEKTRKKVEKMAAPPEKVGEAIYRALTDKNPKTRYLVGKDAFLLNLLRLLPDKILDDIICSNLKLKND